MGTADYCILVVLVLSGLVTLSILHDEQRLADRKTGKQRHAAKRKISQRQGHTCDRITPQQSGQPL